jgi:hypothetical protein
LKKSLKLNMKRVLTLFLFGLILFPFNIYSQTIISPQSQKRVALVIGNGNYTSSILSNPENDARSMKNVLQSFGFIVYEYENLNQNQMKKAIDDFGLKLMNSDVGLFFYAGHGIQSNGFNYLIPVDAQLITEKQIEYDCVQADRILALMEGSHTKVNIIILDACRNNPFERSWTRSSTGRGLAFMNAPSGTLIAYSTAPGNTAQDGSGNNSPYTSAVLESIKISGISITQMFQNVTKLVSQQSGKQQIPWISSSLTSDFYFDKTENLTSNDLNNLIEDPKDQPINFNKESEKESTNINNINSLRFDKNDIPYINGIQTSFEDAEFYMKTNDPESYKIYKRYKSAYTAWIIAGGISFTGGLFGVVITDPNSPDFDKHLTRNIIILGTAGLATSVISIVKAIKISNKKGRWLTNYNSATIGYIKLVPTENGFGLVMNF